MAKLRRRPWGRGEVRRQPDGKIRKSQLITTFGPGAMVDLVDHAVLVGGLDYWRFDSRRRNGGKRVIHEPRLRDTLAERLRARGLTLSVTEAFIEPPAGDDQDPTETAGVAALEFPRWFVCQNQGCRALTRSDVLERKDGRLHHDCDGRKKKTECVPVRFVLACRHGHLDEFPWIWFAHRTSESCAAPQLRLEEGATGDFSELKIRCACGATASLANALAKGSLPGCTGRRPWLGHEGQQKCEEDSRLLVRTASNSYFAQVVSALSIPDPARELAAAVDLVWDVLSAATEATLPVFRQVPKVGAALEGYRDADVLAVVEAHKAGREAPQERLRTAEFERFVSSPVERPGELPHRDDDFFARQAERPADAPDQLEQLVVASKLREVRVQIGFTRLESATADLQGEYDVGVETAALALTKDYLPAAEIHGEGVFLRFSEEAIREWEERPEVKKREEALLAGYHAWTKQSMDPEAAPPFPGARFYMLHSLSHLLVTAISLECGYAASAIRERIYCAPANDPTPMAGILLSTGTSGQEGTLGGLVEQGRRLTDHLRRAWDYGVLCSNDPVCAGHTPRADHAERHLEGAACHGCLFIAECSCERFNRYLDRALVVPAIGLAPERAAQLAFLPERP